MEEMHLSAFAAAVLCLVAASDWRRRAAARAGRDVRFLDLPLGLSLSFVPSLDPVPTWEGLRQTLVAAGYQVDERLSFRFGDGPSPWFGSLCSPRVFVGSLELSRTATGPVVHGRISTVPAAGWALLGFGSITAGWLAAHAEGAQGPWVWATAGILALAVRAAYHALARVQAGALVRLITVPGERG
ncbi:MAG: hypothetical protein ACYCWW_04115 [Deltaproteobacteria bacterium]